MSEIEFIEDIHTYLIDGIIAPSVTQIVGWATGEDYSSVPPTTLRAKAEYGNCVHEWIETYSTTGEELEQTDEMKQSTDQWKVLKDQKKIQITKCENIVSYKNLYAGKYDMLGFVGSEFTLIDIKTTAKYYEDKLSWQLGMYKLAIEETEGIKIDKCMCLWAPKKKILALRDVHPKNKEEIEEVCEKYHAEICN